MNNILDPLPLNTSRHITCRYKNATNRLQIIRIANLSNWYFERAVFPQQQFIFHALPEALLEVHSSETVTAIQSDRIPCPQLRLAEPIELPTGGSPVGVVGHLDYSANGHPARILTEQ